MYTFTVVLAVSSQDAGSIGRLYTVKYWMFLTVELTEENSDRVNGCIGQYQLRVWIVTVNYSGIYYVIDCEPKIATLLELLS